MAKKKVAEMTDAELGAGVRGMIAKYPAEFESEVMCIEACGRIFCSVAAKMNADELKVTVNEASYKGRPIGNWIVTAKRVKKPE